QRGRPEQTEPEIRRVDLAGAVLQLLCLGEADVSRFPWLEPPREATVAQALSLLRRLGAADDRGATALGRVLARLPVHPRVGRLLRPPRPRPAPPLAAARGAGRAAPGTAAGCPGVGGGGGTAFAAGGVPRPGGPAPRGVQPARCDGRRPGRPAGAVERRDRAG